MDKSQVHYWIIKGRPRDNNFEDWLASRVDDTWRTGKPPKSWSPGDRLFFWEASPASRVVGLGRLKEIRKKKNKDGDSLFDVEYLTRPLANRPSINELRLNTKLIG